VSRILYHIFGRSSLLCHFDASYEHKRVTSQKIEFTFVQCI